MDRLGERRFPERLDLFRSGLGCSRFRSFRSRWSNAIQEGHKRISDPTEVSDHLSQSPVGCFPETLLLPEPAPEEPFGFTIPRYFPKALRATIRLGCSRHAPTWLSRSSRSSSISCSHQSMEPSGASPAPVRASA